jgi:hypothetical protein
MKTKLFRYFTLTGLAASILCLSSCQGTPPPSSEFTAAYNSFLKDITAPTP